MDQQCGMSLPSVPLGTPPEACTNTPQLPGHTEFVQVLWYAPLHEAVVTLHRQLPCLTHLLQLVLAHLQQLVPVNLDTPGQRECIAAQQAGSQVIVCIAF